MTEAIILHCANLPAVSWLSSVSSSSSGYRRCLNLDGAGTTGARVIFSERRPYAVIASASMIAEALFREDSGLLFLSSYQRDSVYVFGFEQTETCRNLLRFLTGDTDAEFVLWKPYRYACRLRIGARAVRTDDRDSVEVAPASGDLAFAVSTGSAELQHCYHQPAMYSLASPVKVRVSTERLFHDSGHPRTHPRQILRHQGLFLARYRPRCT
jgi:hypothetical protein